MSEHCFTDLERQDEQTEAELALCRPFDTESEIKTFAGTMASNRTKAKGQGISPILWIIAMRQSMSDKQYRAARYFLSYSVRKWRAIEAYLVGDDETLRYATERGYV